MIKRKKEASDLRIGVSIRETWKEYLRWYGQINHASQANEKWSNKKQTTEKEMEKIVWSEIQRELVEMA